MSNESGGPQATNNGRKVRADFEEDVAPVDLGSKGVIRNEKQPIPGPLRSAASALRGTLHHCRKPLVSLAEPEPKSPALRPACPPAAGGEPESLGGPPPYACPEPGAARVEGHISIADG